MADGELDARLNGPVVPGARPVGRGDLEVVGEGMQLAVCGAERGDYDLSSDPVTSNHAAWSTSCSMARRWSTAGCVDPRTAGWARDALSLNVSAYALEQSLVRQRRRHQDQDQDQEWVLGHEELLDRFSALPAEKFPQTRRHAAELISGTGHDRFEFALGLLMNNLRPASG